MKQSILFIIIALCSLLITSSCVQTHNYIEPVADYTITYIDENNQTVELAEPYTVKANAELTFTFTGSGDFVTFWLGDEKHDYSEYLEITQTAIDNNSEEFVKKVSKGQYADDLGQLIYSYKEVGEYNIVMFVSSNKDFGSDFPYDSIERKITVTE